MGEGSEKKKKNERKTVSGKDAYRIKGERTIFMWRKSVAAFDMDKVICY